MLKNQKPRSLPMGGREDSKKKALEQFDVEGEVPKYIHINIM